MDTLTFLPAVPIVALMVCLVGFYFIRLGDGPVGPIPGGELRSGRIASGNEFELDSDREVSLVVLQTMNPPRSRTTGVIAFEGALFIPCDLGFIWRRVAPPAKWVMALVWYFKRWQDDVLLDGRVVVKIGGVRYERQAVKVDDPQLIEMLEDQVEMRAEKFLSSPLGPRPAIPGPILFFRLDARLEPA